MPTLYNSFHILLEYPAPNIQSLTASLTPSSSNTKSQSFSASYLPYIIHSIFSWTAQLQTPNPWQRPSHHHPPLPSHGPSQHHISLLRTQLLWQDSLGYNKLKFCKLTMYRLSFKTKHMHLFVWFFFSIMVLKKMAFTMYVYKNLEYRVLRIFKHILTFGNPKKTKLIFLNMDKEYSDMGCATQASTLTHFKDHFGRKRWQTFWFH